MKILGAFLLLFCAISSIFAEQYAVMRKRNVYLKHLPELRETLRKCRAIVQTSNVPGSRFPSLFHSHELRANALQLSMNVANLMIPERYYKFVRGDIVELKKAFTEILKALEKGEMAGKPFHRLDGLDERWRRLFEFVHKYSTVIQEDCFSYGCFGLRKSSVMVNKKRRN